MFALSDYAYTLPKELIAEKAIDPHHDARLMIISRQTGKILEEATFWDLPKFLEKDRALFFNNSRVQKARIRLHGVMMTRKEGEETKLDDGEIFILLDLGNNRFEALVRPGKKLKKGTKIHLGEDIFIIIEEDTNDGRICRLEGLSLPELMNIYGELPLPPYIEYSKEKEKDYQTSFALKDGSVAAPTASLHFTKELMEKIPHEKFFLTLHVGLGTFKGIDTEDIRDYAIHEERAEIDASLFETIRKLKTEGKKIVAVGTTACRTLESLPYVWKTLSEKDHSTFSEEVKKYWDGLTKTLKKKDYIHALVINHQLSIINFSTSIYIYPGESFALIDELITNFHLPESSLLVLVSTLLEKENTLEVYKEAIEKKYRFYSFGDGMYIKS